MDFSRTIRYLSSCTTGLALLSSAAVLAEADPQKPAAKQATKVDQAAQQPQTKQTSRNDKVSPQPRKKPMPGVKQPISAKKAQTADRTVQQPKPKQNPLVKATTGKESAHQTKEIRPATQKNPLENKATAAKQTTKQQPVKEQTQAEAAAPIKQEFKAQLNKKLAQQQAEEEPGIGISKIVLAKGIDKGQPIEPGTSFSQDDESVLAVIYIDNPNREEAAVRVSWQREDGPRWRGFALGIPAAPKYRTVARTFISNREPGVYKCVVSDDSGTVLDLAEFKITK